MNSIARAIDAVGTHGLKRLAEHGFVVVDRGVLEALKHTLEDAGLAIVHHDKFEMLETLYSRIKERSDVNWDEDTLAILRQLERMEALERG